MDPRIDPLAIFTEAEEDMSRQKPFHCHRCHFVWFGVQIDWIEGLPLGVVKTPDYCPCCSSINWESEDEPAPGRLPTAEDGVLAYCKLCAKQFYSRETWLRKQEAIRKSKKHPWLPERINDAQERRNAPADKVTA